MQITKDELRQIIAEEIEKAFERRGLGTYDPDQAVIDYCTEHELEQAAKSVLMHPIHPPETIDDLRKDWDYNTASTPRFKHDCEDDVFLGHYDGADLYFADHGGLAGSSEWEPQGSTVLARFGDDGPNYPSGLVLAEINPPPHPLGEALRRAMARGLLKRKSDASD